MPDMNAPLEKAMVAIFHVFLTPESSPEEKKKMVQVRKILKEFREKELDNCI